MKAFLCIAERMVELASAGPNFWRQSFAGNVFNTAWHAQALLPDDWWVEFHTVLGTDPVSEPMTGFFRVAGVACN